MLLRRNAGWQEWLSAERVVSESDIRIFADLTGDDNPIHTDPDFARTTPFRGCIAHGLLGLSLASGLSVHSPPMRTLAFLDIQEWHFRGPVFPGDGLRVRSRILEKEARSRGRRGVITWEIQVMNRDGRVVQEGVTLTLVEGRVQSERAVASSIDARQYERERRDGHCTPAPTLRDC